MRKLVVLFAVLAMFAAACGGGGDDNGDGESGSDDGGGGGGETLSAEEWCGFNAGVEDLNLFGASADFNSLESSIQGFLEIVDEVEDRAPEEIKDDIAVMGEAMAEFDEVLSEVDYDFLALTEADLAALDNPEVEQASANVSRYADENCGTSASDPADDSDDEAPEVEETPEPEEDVDADDAGDSGDAPDPNDTFRQIMVDTMMQTGLTEEQATCVVDRLDLDQISGEDFNPLEFFNFFEECGVDPTDLNP